MGPEMWLFPTVENYTAFARMSVLLKGQYGAIFKMPCKVRKVR